MSVRIAGVELQDNWRVYYALTKIKGIGRSTSTEIMQDLKIDDSQRVSDLSSEDVSKIAKKLDDYLIEGNLARTVRQNIQRLKTSGTYRGIRHQRGLPTRGQRTRSNARTRRGKRKTVGSYKKDVLSKQKQDAPKKEKE